MAKGVTSEITHYAWPVLHMTYVHTYHTIMSAHQNKVARSMFTPVLKSIGLAKRQPGGWDQLDFITLTDPDQHAHIPCAKRAKTNHWNVMEKDSPPDAAWLCRGGSPAIG